MTNKNEELQDRCIQKVLSANKYDLEVIVATVIQETKDSMGSVEGVDINHLQSKVNELREYIEGGKSKNQAILGYCDYFDTICERYMDLVQPPKAEPVDVRLITGITQGNSDTDLNNIIAGLVSLLHYDSIIDLKNVLEEEIHNLRTFELSQSPQSYQVEISSNGECDIERCGKCKYELINNYKYCPECGTKLIK